jgi:hypothetical protein
MVFSLSAISSYFNRLTYSLFNHYTLSVANDIILLTGYTYTTIIKEGKMAPIFKTIINISIWLMFIKGIVAMGVTLYILALYFNGQASIMEGVASCAVATFAFIMACTAILIKSKLK